VEVRTASADDLPALRDVHRRASLSNAEDVPGLLAHPEYLVLPETEVLAGHTRVAVDADGTVVGFATTVGSGPVRELDDLFVDPTRHRRGIGARLVADAVALVRADGGERLDVVANPRASAFYAAVGFERDGEVPMELGVGIRMHLDLRPDG
jgi:GNAT superfamily N-acetyltransferase